MSPQPPLEPAELLRHRDWIAKLARRLCRDRHDAEDSVQAVFTRALQRPPSHQDNLRGWLAQLLRHCLGMQRRAAQRRTAREAIVAEATRDQHAEATDDAVARAEAHRHLVDAVLRLPQAQRALVLRHYFEQVSVADLAVQSGMSADAVRAHLRRARQQLRAGFETENPDAPRALALLAAAPGTRVPLAAAAAAGLVVSLVPKLLLAALAAAIAFLCWLPWGSVPPPSRATEATGGNATAVAAELLSPQVSPSGHRREASAAADLPAIALHGRLTGLVADVPWRAPIAVRANALFDGAWHAHDAEVEVDADGTFAFALPGTMRRGERLSLRLYPRTLDANYDCEKVAFDERDLRVRKVLELQVRPITQVSGRVVDPNGYPVENAVVFAFDVRAGLPSGRERGQTQTNSTGSYVLRSQTSGELVVLAVPWTSPGQPNHDMLPAGVLVHGVRGKASVAPDIRLVVPARITVAFVRPPGLAAGRIRLHAEFLDRPRTIGSDIHVWDLDRCAHSPPWPLATDAEDLTIPVPPGTRVRLHPYLIGESLLPCHEAQPLDVTAPAECTVELPGALHTLLVNGKGQPVADAWMRAPATALGMMGGSSTVVAKTGRDGLCDLLIGPAPRRVWVSADGYSPAEVIVDPLGPQPQIVELRSVATAPLSITPSSDHPVFDVQVKIGQGPESTTTKLSRANTTIPFVLQLSLGTHRLELGPAPGVRTHDAYLMPSWRNVHIKDDGAIETWIVEHGGHCQVVVDDRRSTPGPVQFWLEPQYGTSMRLQPDRDGAVLSPLVSTGDYTVRAVFDGGERLASARIAAFETTVVTITLP